MSQKTAKNQFGHTVYQSRFGWHPVSYETFLKLKALHAAAWQAVFKVARHRRWANKTHKRPPTEPWLGGGHFVLANPGSVYWSMNWKLLQEVRRCYHLARRGAANPDNVVSLEMTPADIVQLHRPLVILKDAALSHPA